MATKIFSSRADEEGLAYADALSRRKFGISYGQYCGSILIEAIRQGAELPQPSQADKTQQRKSAIASMKAFSKRAHNEEIGHMNDEEIKSLIGDRYE